MPAGFPSSNSTATTAPAPWSTLQARSAVNRMVFPMPGTMPAKGA